MPDGPPKLGTVAGPKAVEEIKAAAGRGFDGGGEAAAHRQPAQPHGEDQLQHHGGPEGRQGVGADAKQAPRQIKAPLGAGDAAEAHRQPQHGGDGQGHHPQLQAGGQALGNDAAHRLLVAEGQAQVAVQQLAHEAHVLLGQGLVEAQLLPEGGAHRFRGPGAQQGVDRITGGQAQQQEHQAGDQPQHHRRQGQPGGHVAQQLAAAAHGWPPACRGLSAAGPIGRNWESTTRPEPSKRGASSWGRAQAAGRTTHTGR